MMKMMLLALACLALAACSSPPPVPEGDPPEPQAAAPADAGSSALRDTINEPLDKARAVEDAQADRNAERDQALEDAGG